MHSGTPRTALGSSRGPTGVDAGRLHRADAVIAAALVAAIAAVYLANGDVLPGNDATPNLYLAARIIEGQGLTFTPSSSPYLYDWTLPGRGGQARGRINDLDQPAGSTTPRELYRTGVVVPVTPYYLADSVRTDPATGERRAIGRFGFGAAVTAIPMLAVVRAFAGDLLHHPEALWFGAKLTASLLVAVSAALVFVTCRRWLTVLPAIVLALAYALATPAWSTSSQSLWQHASNEFFLVVGVFALTRTKESAWASALAGFAFSAAAACRPTSVLFAAAAGAWLLVVDRRAFAVFVAAAMPLAFAIGAYNWYFLGSPLRFGQGEAVSDAVAKTGVPDVWPGHVGTALPGLLISPSRGVLVFSPFLVLVPMGVVLAYRSERYAPLRPLAVAVGLELVLASAHFDWWGGWAYGWRLLVDVGPALVALLVPTMEWLGRATWRRVAFGALLAWSVFVQAIGAFAYDVTGWNARFGYRIAEPSSGGVTYTFDEQVARAASLAHPGSVQRVPLDIDDPAYRGRLWSVRDTQIGWYVSHFDEARLNRREMVASWVDQWRTPSRAP